MKKLTGEQYDRLTEAFLSAFPKKEELAYMLKTKLGKDLEARVKDSGLKNIVFELIRIFESEDQILELIAGAREGNPTNHSLKSIERELLNGMQGGGIDKAPVQTLIANLDHTRKLTISHIKSINHIVKPLLSHGDLSKTCERYDDFINNPKLPTDYEIVQSVINGADSSNEFSSIPIHEHLRSVREQLFNFKRVGFLLKESSWDISDTLDKALKLYKQLDIDEAQKLNQDSELGKSIREKFKNALDDMQYILESTNRTRNYPKVEVPGQLRTTKDILELVETFCRKWQHSAGRILYEEQGLHYTIKKLKLALQNA